MAIIIAAKILRLRRGGDQLNIIKKNHFRASSVTTETLSVSVIETTKDRASERDTVAMRMYNIFLDRVSVVSREASYIRDRASLYGTTEREIR